MAITQTALTFKLFNADDDIFLSDPVTPTANRLLLAWVSSERSGAVPSAPALTSSGLTWVQVATIAFNTVATARSRLTLLRAMGASPGTGAITTTFAGTEVQRCCLLSVMSFAGMDTSGTDGSGAIVQSATAANEAVTSLALSLAAFGAGNGAAMGFSYDGTNALTPEVGWTPVHQFTTTSPNQLLATAWRNSSDTTPSASWSGNRDVGGIAVEIAVAGAGVAESHHWPIYRTRMRQWS